MDDKLIFLKNKKKEYGDLGALNFLIDYYQKKSSSTSLDINDYITYEPFYSKEIALPDDLEKFKNRPSALPKDLVLPPLQGLGNDYSFLESKLSDETCKKVSIVVLTYNRIAPLRKTLTGILNQDYKLEDVEVVVVDDGSRDDTLGVVREFSKSLDIKYFWHPDIGFTPSISRNKGVSISSNDFVILLDVDMYPGRNLIKEYVKYFDVVDSAILIGPRKYVDLTAVDVNDLLRDAAYIEKLPEVITNNEVAGRLKGEKSVDWRLETIFKSDYLKNEKLPFRMFAAGNVAFSKKKFIEVGGFDERFRAWGYEDGELGFRFFNNGMYFIPVMNAWAYHQEPPDGINETDRVKGKSISAHHYASVCPYYRHISKEVVSYEVPKVSIYIPAYNAEKTIVDAVESVLSQTFTDIEVCICDDGSTDKTLYLLEGLYKNNPRVRWVSQLNSGIGKASNVAVGLCRGLYIGQLDSDDILARDAVEKCIPYFEKDIEVGFVYTSYENQYSDGTVKPGYNFPVFSREKLLTGMIAHHFRMFRRRDWARARGFNEKIKNAVDYDFYLRLSEVCKVEHLNIISYRRRLHGSNTSILNNSDQNINAAYAVNQSLSRLGLVSYSANLEDVSSPKIVIKKVGSRIIDETEKLALAAQMYSELSNPSNYKNRSLLYERIEEFVSFLVGDYYAKKLKKSKGVLELLFLLASNHLIDKDTYIKSYELKQINNRSIPIFCSGFGWSGSSAAFDYLRQSKQVDFFGRSEIKIFWKRGFGAIDLLEKVQLGQSSYKDFIDFFVINILGFKDDATPAVKQKYYSERLLNFLNASGDFEIIDDAISGFLISLLKLRAGSVESRDPLNLLLDGLIKYQTGGVSKYCMFDNAILAHECSSLKHIQGAKIVLVSRNPIDMYASRVKDKAWNGAVKKYLRELSDKVRAYNDSFDELSSDQAYCVSFEEFVSNNDVRSRLSSWLGLEIEGFEYNLDVFDPDSSRKNIGIAKKYFVLKEYEGLVSEFDKFKISYKS